jgi:hypothetical protein
MANVTEGRVVHPRVNEDPREATAVRGTVQHDGAKSGADETQARKPSLAEFGWDFPFNSPGPTR